MATVTAATAGRTEQHSAVTDRGLTDFPLGRFNQLVANTLRVPALGHESVSTTEMLAPTLPEFEAAEINDLLLVTQAVTAVRTHCETLKSTALSQEWLPSTAVPGSMSRQSLQLFFTGSTAFSQMSELACTEECGDTVSQLQDAALLLHTGGVQLLWQVWI